jgi:CheY-like chemotaxis protein
MNVEKVLVAVPDLILRAKVSDAVRHAGRTPVSAKSPEGALERARAELPSLVVVDLGDERVAPFDTIRALKADPSTASARVVGFYSHVESHIRDLAHEAGCDEVVPRSAFVKRLSRIVAAE